MRGEIDYENHKSYSCLLQRCGKHQGGDRKNCRPHCEKLGVPTDSYDYTLPDSRTKTQNYGPSDLVVFGTSVYAGRVPNKLLPAVQNCFKADGALAVPVVTFGNRNFDNGLIELRNELENNGFHTVAGAGIACRHVFSEKLAPGRPDEADWGGH